MKLRMIPVPAINDLLVFEEGSTEQKAVWNHVCEGTHCLVSEFDLSIKPLLNAHGVYDIHIEDYAPKNVTKAVDTLPDEDKMIYDSEIKEGQHNE